VIIKQPGSSIALEKLSQILKLMEGRVERCANSKHEFLTVLYVSSYIISTSGISSFQGATALLDSVSKAVNLSPKSFICVVRTSAPTMFHQNLREIQQRAIDKLRSYCYIRLYERAEFVNHAKFIIGYHFCFSEEVFYHGRYYGSTNLTLSGLAYLRGKLGNYEEFTFSQRIELLQKLQGAEGHEYYIARGQEYYIREIRNILENRYNLYTDNQKLKEYLDDGIRHLQDPLRRIEGVARDTTRAQLFQAYAESLALYLHTLAFVDDLPGRMLTSEILSEVERRGVQLPDPTEVEAMLTDSEEVANELADLLNLTEEKLRSETLRYLSACKYVLEVLKQRYRAEEVSQYYDDVERSFAEFLKKNGRAHLEALKKIYAESSF